MAALLFRRMGNEYNAARTYSILRVWAPLSMALLKSTVFKISAHDQIDKNVSSNHSFQIPNWL